MTTPTLDPIGRKVDPNPATSVRAYSWSDLLAIADAAQHNRAPNREVPASKHDKRSSLTGTKSFTGTKDMAAALGLARLGWREGARRMIAAAAGTAVQSDCRPADVYDVAGYMPDVAAYCAGQVDHMIDRDPDSADRAARPVVRLYVNGCYSAGTETEQINNAGLALLGAVDALESSGRSVEVNWMYWTGSYTGSYVRHLITVRFKAAEEHWDLDRAAFVLAHPSMLRRLGFALVESIPEMEKDCFGNGGYGRVRDNVPRELAEDPTCVVLPTVGSQVNGRGDVSTPAAAAALVRDVLAAHGITY